MGYIFLPTYFDDIPSFMLTQKKKTFGLMPLPVPISLSLLHLLIQLWAEKLLSMYQKWAEKQGYRGRIVEKHLAKNGGITSATVEFEFDYAYGYLQGERGVHQMISSETGSTIDEVGFNYHCHFDETLTYG